MKNTTRKKKESFVVFEDWMKYSRFLNDAEFRQFINNILNYYKGIEPVLNTSNLQEVWQDIVDDLSVNIAKKQAKRDTMLKNALSNPKLSTISNTRPDIEPDISPNITPSTNGMVDGRCETGNDKMSDGKMGDDKMMDKKWSPVIHKGETAKYNKELTDDYNEWCQSNPLHSNPSISQSLRLAGVDNIDDYFDNW
jgi:hypothetical protein